jgi:hypothetical protein
MPTPSDADPSCNSASSRMVLLMVAGVGGMGTVPVTMFSMDALDTPAFVCPVVDMLACARAGFVDVIPSYINGVSSHAVTVSVRGPAALCLSRASPPPLVLARS